MSSFLEQIKKKSMQKKVFNVVQKLVFSTDMHYQKIDQDLIVIKLIISNIYPSFFPISLLSNYPNSRNYVSILQKSTLQTPLLLAKPIISKKQEIIICLNNQNQKVILKEISINIIIKNLNVCIESLGYHLIRVVK